MNSEAPATEAETTTTNDPATPGDALPTPVSDVCSDSRRMSDSLAPFEASASRRAQRRIDQQRESELFRERQAEEASRRGLRNLFIAWLPPTFTDQNLHELASPVGPVASCRVIHDDRRSYGFVMYADSATAAEAVKYLGRQTVNGRRLQVHLSRKGSVSSSSTLSRSTPATPNNFEGSVVRPPSVLSGVFSSSSSLRPTLHELSPVSFDASSITAGTPHHPVGQPPTTLHYHSNGPMMQASSLPMMSLSDINNALPPPSLHPESVPLAFWDPVGHRLSIDYSTYGTYQTAPPQLHQQQQQGGTELFAWPVSGSGPYAPPENTPPQQVWPPLASPHPDESRSSAGAFISFEPLAFTATSAAAPPPLPYMSLPPSTTRNPPPPPPPPFY